MDDEKRDDECACGAIITDPQETHCEDCLEQILYEACAEYQWGDNDY